METLEKTAKSIPLKLFAKYIKKSIKEKEFEKQMELPEQKSPLFDGLLSVIVPCKNETEMIASFYAEFEKTIATMGSPNYEIIFVDDGSTDTTLAEIQKLAEKNPQVQYISFTRNFGKESAMYAGLKSAKGDYITIMDADLQDPPSLLPEMFNAILNEGFDSASARRRTRDGEPPVRTFFAKVFYDVLNKLSPLKFVEGARDYRLMTREMLNAVLELCEYNRFTKGIYEWVGYKTKWIEYDNIERPAGQTKWTLWQLAIYSIDALTSFSSVPLILVSFLGIIFCAFSALAIVFLSIRQLIFHNSAYGWTSMICIIFFLSGIQLFCIGILGQYISKIYLETKHRPHFIIKKKS